MLDFLRIAESYNKSGGIEIFPKFVVNTRSSDLMIRGGDFYAVWDERKNLWSTNEQDLIDQVDMSLQTYADEKHANNPNRRIRWMWDSDSASIDKWHRYVKSQMRDSWHRLDEKIVFSNETVKKEDYVTKIAPYPLAKGDITAYTTLFSALYTPEQLRKLEWAVGSIFAGDSKRIQKFIVIYGDPGTGKSTFLDLIELLFDGWLCHFEAKDLTRYNADFALEPFRNNPLVAVQQDGDLSRIEDNTKLNSIVSHDSMILNAKFEKKYEVRFFAFLFLATNKAVRITDAKAGIIRRLIDVEPKGGKPFTYAEYFRLKNRLQYELGAIAYHCLEVYKTLGEDYYENYVPTSMISATNDFYNFMLSKYDEYDKTDCVTRNAAWKDWKNYCEFAGVPMKPSLKVMQVELAAYFDNYIAEYRDETGRHVRQLYSGFKRKKFEIGKENDEKVPETAEKEVEESGRVEQNDDLDIGDNSFADSDIPEWLRFKEQPSIFDEIGKDYPAQYAKEDGTPRVGWDYVKTTLKDINTAQLHWVKPPVVHIIIDLDHVNSEGKKDIRKNIEAAMLWPPTYAELSKSGQAIHLHYIWTGGNPEKLSLIAKEHEEVKVYSGKLALRRKLTKCNNLPIAELSSGLDYKKEDGKTNDEFVIKNEKQIFTMVQKCLNREYNLPSTKCFVDYIYDIFEQAYDSGIPYDLESLKPRVLRFANGSTNNRLYCIKKVSQMHFRSLQDVAALPDADIPEDAPELAKAVYDVEVYPNFCCICYKPPGASTCVRMPNPTVDEVKKFRASTWRISFNGRKYDEHILIGMELGYTNRELYNLSKSIIQLKTGFFSEGYGSGGADIYDFASKKQSLKKWEIQLEKEGYPVKHKECRWAWDEDVPESAWEEVMDYCCNDVDATDILWHYPAIQQDFVAREALADIAHGSVIDTTRILTTKFIFGSDKHPQLVYTDLRTGEQFGTDNPMPRELNSWPEYEYINDQNMYKGINLGKGGLVVAYPGMYINVALLDIESLHPNSAKWLQIFGEKTKRFVQILETRLAIKHKNFDKAREIMPEIAKYLESEEQAAALAQAFKIIINSVYGYTSASFDNPFRDERNVNNIVALRGALFMAMLMFEVEEKGYKVVHIKTDSIKIENADNDIIEYCKHRARDYGYNFDHEATYAKMCLVNDAVYVAKYASEKWCLDNYGYIPSKQKSEKWTATGTQFQVPYVFKTLFSKEPIDFYDLTETKAVTSALYLDMNEKLPDVSEQENELDKLEKKFKKGGVDNETYLRTKNRLIQDIKQGHEYIFVGRVGLFCPIKPGCGGGLLMRDAGNGKYAAATGTTGYRWLEADDVKLMGASGMDIIDMSYYRKLVDDAYSAIAEYGDANWFLESDEVTYIPNPVCMAHPEDDPPEIDDGDALQEGYIVVRKPVNAA